jgi:hypothetical protein
VQAASQADWDSPIFSWSVLMHVPPPLWENRMVLIRILLPTLTLLALIVSIKLAMAQVPPHQPGILRPRNLQIVYGSVLNQILIA